MNWVLENVEAVDTHAEEIEPELLNPISMPLTGHALIEASAGTGKTYTLAALYLRLLLGIGRENPLEVDKILVVTFTDAATQELRERIRARIQEARIAFVLGESEDHFIQQLLTLHQDHERAILDLEFAASEMDQAAIFTIHGFCQRMLKQHAFESGASFNAELIKDDTAIVRQALLDYWRKELYLAPQDLAYEILTCYATPDKLLSKIRPYLGLSELILEPDYQNFALLERWQMFCELQQCLRDDLQKVLASAAAEDDLISLIASSSVDKRSYSKRYLPIWLNKLAAFAMGETAPFKELLKFSQAQLEQKSKTQAVPRHPIFEQVEAFCALQIDFKAVIFCRALRATKVNMQLHKQQFQQLCFDDLLQQLAHALHRPNGHILAKTIRQQYPFGLIDEFQDTDPEQYAIFSSVYHLGSNTDTHSSKDIEAPVLLMIGDPKQSIYAFRGADVFTYMGARRQVAKHFTLGTNWRSSEAMVSATNHLFSRCPAPFIYRQDIPFYPVSAAKNQPSELRMAGEILPAMSFWYTDKAINIDQYLTSFASVFATQIARMLKEGSVRGRKVMPSNIAVLVRDRREAALVQEALKQHQVDSVFMSNRDNVYGTHIARELQYLLKAVNDPSNERFLRCALACEIFQLSSRELFDLNQNEIAWEGLVEEFLDYRKTWWHKGVLPMLHALLQRRKLATRWLSDPQGERRLTDYLHLAELLQNESVELESNEGLIRFLQEARLQSSQQSQEQQLRLDSDRSRVTVITIHKSKGLEYDLVYIPFTCRYRSPSNLLFHNASNQAVLDTSGGSGEYAALLEKEQLAEDLRLLYVAITRAAHGCFIGMANVCSRNKSVWHKTAIGYLLTLIKQDNQSTWLKDIALHKALELVSEGNTHIDLIDTQSFEQQSDLFDKNELVSANKKVRLSARKFSRVLRHDWRITSYSALSKHHLAAGSGALQREMTENNTPEQLSVIETDKIDLDVSAQIDLTIGEDLQKSIFSFAKGAAAGTFLHSIYEQIDFFTAEELQILTLLEKRLPLAGYDTQWAPSLAEFVYYSLQVPLNILHQDAANLGSQSFCLNHITAQNRLVEMEFLLPFKAIHCDAINLLLARFDPLAAKAGALTFKHVLGMLKGFIDLTARHDGKYFIIDYKSNHLGNQIADYNSEKLAQAMIEHRYDFQYVLYTLALHRLLKSRIATYDYEQYIGGVFYLFLRGMAVNSTTGIFYTRPKRQLIEQLDKLFEEGA